MITSLFFIAPIITLAATAVCRSVGLVDKPDERKRHVGSVPLSGGIAVFVTILLGTFILNIPPYTTKMMAIAIIVFALGVFDDFQHTNPWLRLLVQYGAGIALATYGGIVINNVGDLLMMGAIPLMVLAAPLTALAVAGLSNAYNMIDGIDGLSASLMLVPLVVLSSLAAMLDHPMLNSLMLMVLPLAVFLIFNLGPNWRYLPKIFLGDGGSITMGFLITASLVYFSQGESALIKPVTALWLVTVPLMDMLATMARRYRNGRPLMEADRSHLHYSLMDLGLSSSVTLIVIVAYAACCALLGLLLENLPEYVSMFGFFALFVLHLAFIVIVSRNLDSRTETNERATTN
jgi:UDP-GlcNAc:undecaprenyl-phosphate GlcNAc-1-phosphate transferase